MMLKVKIEGTKKLVGQLTRMANRAEKDKRPVAIVAYKEHYAPIIHENIEMKLVGIPRPSGKGTYWSGYQGGRGQSKFLEAPARTQYKMIGLTIKLALDKGIRFPQALLQAARKLRDMSKDLVPVEYGALRKSAVARLEK